MYWIKCCVCTCHLRVNLPKVEVTLGKDGTDGSCLRFRGWYMITGGPWVPGSLRVVCDPLLYNLAAWQPARICEEGTLPYALVNSSDLGAKPGRIPREVVHLVYF